MMKYRFAAPVGVALTTAIAASPVASADTAVDSATSITSRVPVPGGFTAGSWNISNPGTEAIPAGSTYVATFSQLDGSDTPSSLTFTSTNSRAGIVKISGNQFRLTLRSALVAGQSISGLWSDAHLFNVRVRDKVSLSLDSTPGVTDINPSNNASTYDFAGLGF